MTAPIEGVATVSLDWPERRNALGPPEADELADRLRAADDADCRCVVLRGEGPTFSAGGDLRAVLALVEQGEAVLRDHLYRSFQGLFATLRGVTVPVVAALEGPAIGLGLDLALACDLRYVAPGAWVRQGWSSLGLIPATGGFFDVRTVAGPQAAWRLLAAGSEKIDAETLATWGLAEVADDPEEAALRAAGNLASNPRDRLVATKALVRERDLDVHLDLALDHQVRFLLDDRFRETAERLLGGA